MAMRVSSFFKKQQRICLPVVACDVCWQSPVQDSGCAAKRCSTPLHNSLRLYVHDSGCAAQRCEMTGPRRPLSLWCSCRGLAGALARDAAPGDDPIRVNVAVVCEAYHRADGKRSDRDSGGIALRVRSGRNRDRPANVHAPEAEIEPCCWQIAVHLRLAMGPVGGDPHRETAGTERPSHSRHSGTEKARAD